LTACSSGTRGGSKLTGVIGVKGRDQSAAVRSASMSVFKVFSARVTDSCAV
jgi:hypothetical protein